MNSVSTPPNKQALATVLPKDTVVTGNTQMSLYIGCTSSSQQCVSTEYCHSIYRRWYNWQCKWAFWVSDNTCQSNFKGTRNNQLGTKVWPSKKSSKTVQNAPNHTLRNEHNAVLSQLRAKLMELRTDKLNYLKQIEQSFWYTKGYQQMKHNMLKHWNSKIIHHENKL